jgi:predicted PurR-regulated permease PerM
MTRNRAKLLIVAGATLVSLYLTFLLAVPFLPALVWAVTGAVLARPSVLRLSKWISWRPAVAGIATSATALVLFLPAISLLYFVSLEIANAVQTGPSAEQYLAKVQDVVDSRPRMAKAWDASSRNFDLAGSFGRALDQLRDTATGVASGFVYTFVQALIALFILFYLIRDHDAVLVAVRRLSPLSAPETTALLNRLADTIHATMFGTVIAALVQGALGGTIFWLLGLPTPALWGLAMGLMAIVPYLGAFVIWVPAAAFLAIQGEWWKAGALALWGSVVIGLIDNLIYPILVGNRLQQHTVVAFIAIVGGIAVFGASGIILGPVIVTLTIFLVELWRRRARAGDDADLIAG